MSMMRSKPFMERAGHQALPDDIAEPLKLKGGTAGSVVCWARTAIEAAHRLHLLGLLEEPDPRSVTEVDGNGSWSVQMLDRQQDWYCGTVLAFGLFGDSPIVEIDFGRETSSYARPSRKVTVIGVFRTAATVVELDRPEATYAQTNVALSVLGWRGYLIGGRRMRRAVSAALRTGR